MSAAPFQLWQPKMSLKIAKYPWALAGVGCGPKWQNWTQLKTTVLASLRKKKYTAGSLMLPLLKPGCPFVLLIQNLDFCGSSYCLPSLSESVTWKACVTCPYWMGTWECWAPYWQLLRYLGFCYWICKDWSWDFKKLTFSKSKGCSLTVLISQAQWQVLGI